MTSPERRPLEIVRPLLRTRQVRQFTPEPPSDEQIDAIAEVARWTGSSTNEQPWRFGSLAGREELAKLALGDARTLDARPRGAID